MINKNVALHREGGNNYTSLVYSDVFSFFFSLFLFVMGKNQTLKTKKYKECGMC